MKRILFLFAWALACVPLAYGERTTATTIRDFIRIQRDYTPGSTYRIRGTVVQILRKNDYVAFYIRDKTGLANASCSPGWLPIEPQSGDIVEISGSFTHPHRPTFDDLKLEILGHGPAPQPDALSDDEIRNELFDNRHVRVRGIIRDVFQDEIDPDWIFFVANVNGRTVTATCPAFGMSGKASAYLGVEAEITGIGTTSCSYRRFSGAVIVMPDERAIRVIGPTWPDPFSAPALTTVDDGIPAQVNGLGRRCVSGTVMAVWHGNTFLLGTGGGQAVAVQVADGPLPKYGNRVTASGIPETDYYRIILAHATWRTEKRPEDGGLRMVAKDITPAELLENEKGEFRVKTTAYGQVIRIVGTIRHLPSESSHYRRIFIEADGYLIPADVSALPEILPQLQLGCRIAVSGVCIMEYESDTVPGRFPRIRGFAVVPREAGDIRVLARPPWWTPSRLMTLLGIIFAVLVGTVVWNISLNRRARRKGEELAQEQLARVASELKADERTRLAVELHDSLSQTLTGVSMQIDTAAGFARSLPAAVTHCLTLASRTIDACRMELRNTLWDLRSEALDEPDMNRAIRRTLRQNLEGVRLSVRFDVPRAAFSDRTAHAVLKIIRELCANAIRHGKATEIRIAGAIDGERLAFSVCDNGCGFDPATAPGMGEGHFGLQGITERLERLDGELAVDSAPGKGTRTRAFIRMSRLGYDNDKGTSR